MTREDILKNISEFPDFVTLLMESAAEKQANLLSQLQCAAHSTEPLVEQVIYALYYLTDASAKPVAVTITHEEIAQLIGRTRVSVTNTLRKLQEEGSIETGHSMISILQPLKLWQQIGEI